MVVFLLKFEFVCSKIHNNSIVIIDGPKIKKIIILFINLKLFNNYQFFIVSLVTGVFFKEMFTDYSNSNHISLRRPLPFSFRSDRFLTTWWYQQNYEGDSFLVQKSVQNHVFDLLRKCSFGAERFFEYAGWNLRRWDKQEPDKLRFLNGLI